MASTLPISLFFSLAIGGSDLFGTQNKVAHIAHVTSSIIQNSILRYIYYSRSDTMDLYFIPKNNKNEISNFKPSMLLDVVTKNDCIHNKIW